MFDFCIARFGDFKALTMNAWWGVPTPLLRNEIGG